MNKDGTGADEKLSEPFEISDGIRVSVYRDGGAILDVNGGRVFSLNATGSRILALVQQGLPVEEIVATMSREFQKPAETVRADVDRFFESLRSWKLLG